MKSAQPGKNISRPEVTNVSAHGFWLLVEDKELFLPFEHFPWFKDATIRQIAEIETFDGNHLHWPLLDVDLSLKIIENPQDYKLVSK
jgi:hypothetical protein